MLYTGIGPAIASKVWNLQREHACPRLCSDIYKRFNVRKGIAPSNYHKCGRKPWKITPDVKKFLVAKLKELRTKCICTSTTLQTELANTMGVKISSSAVRRVLFSRGYK